MADTMAKHLVERIETAWNNLSRQLDGLEPHLERADAPGEYTVREVVSHLLFPEGWHVAQILAGFDREKLPVVDLAPGDTALTPARRAMALPRLVEALDAQRQGVVAYVSGLSDADLRERKARIPAFRSFVGTDEISIADFVGAMFDFHWNDHAGQIGKIRQTVGLPAAR